MSANRTSSTPLLDPHAKQPVLTAGPRPGDAAATLLLVHGRGASAQSILSLYEELDLPDLAALAPQAAGGGRPRAGGRVGGGRWGGGRQAGRGSRGLGAGVARRRDAGRRQGGEAECLARGRRWGGVLVQLPPPPKPEWVGSKLASLF